jgi:hypothetical protein
MTGPIDRQEVIRCFESLRAAFPQLKIFLELQPPEVDLNLDIPKQSGLVFDLNLNLQGDELHLHAGHLWLRLSPSDDPDVVEECMQAVRGLLVGDYRVVEYYRGRRVVKAQLQRPAQGDWETIGTWQRFHLPLPWRRSTRVLQNISSDQ